MRVRACLYVCVYVCACVCVCVESPAVSLTLADSWRILAHLGVIPKPVLATKLLTLIVKVDDSFVHLICYCLVLLGSKPTAQFTSRVKYKDQRSRVVF